MFSVVKNPVAPSAPVAGSGSGSGGGVGSSPPPEDLLSVLSSANVLSLEDRSSIVAFFSDAACDRDRDTARYKLNVEVVEDGGGTTRVTDYLEVDWRGGNFRRLRKQKRTDK